MSNYVNQAVEVAAVAYLLKNLPDWLEPERVYKGVDNPEEEGWFNQAQIIRRYPCVVCMVEICDPVLPNYHGAWKVRLELQVWTGRNRNKDAVHETHCRDIWDRFLTTSIEQDLMDAYGAATGEQLWLKKVIPAQNTVRAEGRAWLSILPLDLEEVGHTSADQLQA